MPLISESRCSPLREMVSSAARAGQLAPVPASVELQLFCEAEDRGHRRADLVAHVREELGLEPRRVDRLLARAHQRGPEAAMAARGDGRHRRERERERRADPRIERPARGRVRDRDRVHERDLESQQHEVDRPQRREGRERERHRRHHQAVDVDLAEQVPRGEQERDDHHRREQQQRQLRPAQSDAHAREHEGDEQADLRGDRVDERAMRLRHAGEDRDTLHERREHEQERARALRRKAQDRLELGRRLLHGR